MIPNVADAHQKHRVKKGHTHNPTPTVVVTIGWTWVEATLFRSAHWHHPHYGRSHRAFTSGPPPVRPHANSVWVPGHWEGRGRHHRHWVPGHWKR